MPLTVTNLARACGLSRSAVLYYETIGLLKPPRRTVGNYRIYGQTDFERLRRICVYRDAGLKISNIRSILGEVHCDATRVLKRRLVELSDEMRSCAPTTGPVICAPGTDHVPRACQPELLEA
jgi:DNA-binding transcriptional MerR regulator